MGALTNYITATQDLLHDPAGRFWTQGQLTGYINVARVRTAADTKCLRQLVTGGALQAGIEVYSISSVSAFAPAGYTVLSVLGITIYWGNLRTKLLDWSFTKADARLRYLQNYQDIPVVFARMGTNQFYVAPVPNQVYTADFDVTLAPSPLVTDADQEPIPLDYQEIVPYYAAYKAKLNEQQGQEADKLFEMYRRQAKIANAAYMPRVIPDAYQVP